MTPALRTAVVLAAHPDGCDVALTDEVLRVPYSGAFAPRADGLLPGQLVALATTEGSGEVVVWRWFDAVVRGERAGEVVLWEAAHGEVLARRRDASATYPPGTRAYASAGLPGAEWWVAGAVAPPGRADVELAEVAAFYDEHGLWDAPDQPAKSTSAAVTVPPVRPGARACDQ